MPKVYGYIRVSTDEQAEQGVSLAAQRQAVLARGAQEVFEDAGVSSGVPLAERPAGARLSDVLQRGDTVIAPKLDRFFRSAVECLVQIDAWRAQGVEVVLLDMGLDTTTPMGRMVLTMLAGMAELERALIRERTRAGMAQVRREGGIVGRAPYGFRYAPERGPDGRRPIEESPEEVEVLVRVAALRGAGLTWAGIADTLNGEGCKTRLGCDWERRNLSGVFSRKVEKNAHPLKKTLARIGVEE